MNAEHKFRIALTQLQCRPTDMVKKLIEVKFLSWFSTVGLLRYNNVVCQNYS